MKALKQNTYVDNLMKTASEVEELMTCKYEASEILETAKFTVHQWESNIEELDQEKNPTKILGHNWDKRSDTLEIQVKPPNMEAPVTKRQILKDSWVSYPLPWSKENGSTGRHLTRGLDGMGNCPVVL
jgi:hypothetical protein